MPGLSTIAGFCLLPSTMPSSCITFARRLVAFSLTNEKPASHLVQLLGYNSLQFAYNPAYSDYSSKHIVPVNPNRFFSFKLVRNQHFSYSKRENVTSTLPNCHGTRELLPPHQLITLPKIFGILLTIAQKNNSKWKRLT